MSDFRRPVFESTYGNETSESVYGMVKSKSCLQIIDVESFEMKVGLISGLEGDIHAQKPQHAAVTRLNQNSVSSTLIR